MSDRLEKNWLEALLERELDRHDPKATPGALPPDVWGADASSIDLAGAARILVARSLRWRPVEGTASTPRAPFLEDVRAHVALLLDLGVLRGASSDRDRRRAEMAAFLAAAVDDTDAALAVRLEAAARPRAVTRAIASAELALATRFLPHGDPLLGLPLHHGHVAVLRRRLARCASGFHREGRLDPAALARHARYAQREATLLAEALAGLLLAAAPPDAQALALRQRQLARLGLPRPVLREAKAAVAAPRAAAEIGAAAPSGMRPFLAEQLFLAVLRADLSGDGATRYVEAFIAAARLEPATLAAAQVEAAAQHGERHAWFAPAEAESRILRQGLAGDWDAATDVLVERVSTVVTENVGSLVTEIRETGELGQLLARAAAGGTLSAEEKRRVRAQLIDLAKAVPALAIFAAPGGMLLLPLLAKLLPFNLLPSAWDRAGDAKKPEVGPDGTPPGKIGVG